jgi:LPXTG-site transpeptidase (sortase) family protein
MSSGKRISLDNQVFNGRVRTYNDQSVNRQVLDIKPIANAEKPIQPINYQDINPVTPKSITQKSKVFAKHIDVDNPNQTLPKQQKTSIKYIKSLTRNRKIGYALSFFAILFIVIGILLSFYGLKTNRQVEAQVKAMQADNSTDRPTNTNDYDETPVNNIMNYQVSPDMPRFIKILSINVFARVKRVSVDSNNTVQSPKGIFDTGWYDGSAKPGESGVMFIDGHVSGPTSNGVFYNLKKLRTGDSIEIERGDGKKYKYKVAAVEKYDANNVDMQKALRSYYNNIQGLNLMTCTGRFLPKERSFSERIVVYTFLQ